MGQKPRRLNPADRVFDQLAELLALLLGDGGSQVLNFDQPLADENNLSDLGDAGHPRVANKLGIESQETGGFFGVATGGGLPLQETAGAVQLADGVDISHEIIAARQWLDHFDLQIATRLVDTNAVVLAEAGEQQDALLEHAIPGVVVREAAVPDFCTRTIRETDVPGILPAKEAPSACSKARPNSIAARLSFSFQPSR